MKLNIQLFAHTNATTNYELPQFVGTDKPTWLGDFNEAMSDIDTGMHENATAISTMQTDVNNAVSTASQASQNVTTLTGTVNTLSSTVSSVQTTANNASQTASSALNTANTANGKADTNASAISSINTTISNLSDKIDESESFSSTEVEIGTWIDGKPLYRTVVNSGVLPNNSTKTIPHSISNIKKITFLHGVAHNTVTDGYIPLPYASVTASQTCMVYASVENIYFTTQADLSNYLESYMIVEYTKTTD